MGMFASLYQHSSLSHSYHRRDFVRTTFLLVFSLRTFNRLINARSTRVLQRRCGEYPTQKDFSFWYFSCLSVVSFHRATYEEKKKKKRKRKWWRQQADFLSYPKNKRSPSDTNDDDDELTTVSWRDSIGSLQ